MYLCVIERISMMRNYQVYFISCSAVVIGILSDLATLLFNDQLFLRTVKIHIYVECNRDPESGAFSFVKFKMRSRLAITMLR